MKEEKSFGRFCMSVRRKIEIAPKPSTTRKQVGHLEGWLAEKFLRALLLELDQLAQDEGGRSGRDESVFRGHVRLRFAGDVFEDFLEILQVEQRQTFVVAEFVDQRDEARLRFIQPEHAGKRSGPNSSTVARRRAPGSFERVRNSTG